MQLSAFVDGELPENEAELLLRRMSQDAELRQQVAEFLAIGRAMRGDVQVSGIERLRERVASAIGEELAEGSVAADIIENRRYVRPMIGFAVAATVALVAIFGLQQVSMQGETDADDMPSDPALAETRTEPELDVLMERIRREHLTTESEVSYETRVVELPVDEEILDQEAIEDAETTDDEAQVEAPVE